MPAALIRGPGPGHQDRDRREKSRRNPVEARRVVEADASWFGQIYKQYSKRPLGYQL